MGIGRKLVPEAGTARCTESGSWMSLCSERARRTEPIGEIVDVVKEVMSTGPFESQGHYKDLGFCSMWDGKAEGGFKQRWHMRILLAAVLKTDG